MATAIILIILIVICIFAVKSYARKLSKGDGCCGERDGDVRKKRVADRKKSNYPHKVILTIEGMSCGNCATRVENALNSIEGVWATVDLGKKTALVRMKQPVEPGILKDAVLEAGYFAKVS